MQQQRVRSKSTGNILIREAIDPATKGRLTEVRVDEHVQAAADEGTVRIWSGKHEVRITLTRQQAADLCEDLELFAGDLLV